MKTSTELITELMRTQTPSITDERWITYYSRLSIITQNQAIFALHKNDLFNFILWCIECYVYQQCTYRYIDYDFDIDPITLFFDYINYKPVDIEPMLFRLKKVVLYNLIWRTPKSIRDIDLNNLILEYNLNLWNKKIS